MAGGRGPRCGIHQRAQGHSGHNCGSRPQVTEQYQRWFRALGRRAHPQEMPTTEIHVTYVMVRAPHHLGPCGVLGGHPNIWVFCLPPKGGGGQGSHRGGCLDPKVLGGLARNHQKFCPIFAPFCPHFTPAWPLFVPRKGKGRRATAPRAARGRSDSECPPGTTHFQLVSSTSDPLPAYFLQIQPIF